MKKIPTFKVNTELAEDLKYMHAIDIQKELHGFILAQAKENVIFVTEGEYKDNFCKVVNEWGVTSKQYIASKIIGIEKPNGTIEVVDMLGKQIKVCKNKFEFEKNYFIEAL
jgi:hypothetical protein